MKFRGKHRKTTFGESGKIFEKQFRFTPAFSPIYEESSFTVKTAAFCGFSFTKAPGELALFAALSLRNLQILSVLNGAFSGKNGLLKKSERKEVKSEMITGIKKKNKLTEIWFDETGSAVTVRTYNTDLKNRLTAYAANYPKFCRLTDDDECGCLSFEIDRKRFSIRLTAPYSKERRSKARKTMEAIQRKKQE